MKVAIVCYHAGGAEIISNYIIQNKVDCHFVLDGPAVEIFKNRFNDFKNYTIEEALVNCDSFLTGTGCVSDWEWNAIKLAKKNGKKVISFLDHWVNYRARFIRDGNEQIPDEVWVGDQHAQKIAKRELKDYRVKHIDNPYFKDMNERFNSKILKNNSSSATKILYVCENINKPDFNQIDSIKYFLDNLSALVENPDLIIIRPHPSEDCHKYDWLCDEYDLPIEISKKSSLFNDIVNCQTIAGCTSMAMVIGLIAKRRVVSCIPNKEIPITLPFQKIEILSNILEKNI